MKYIVCEKPHEFLMKEREMPVRKEGEVLLKIRKIGVWQDLIATTALTTSATGSS